jgi:hypothetical protein
MIPRLEQHTLAVHVGGALATAWISCGALDGAAKLSPRCDSAKTAKL